MFGPVRHALARSSALKQLSAPGRFYAVQRSGLSSLVFVETKGSGIEEGALNAITAARKLSGPVTAVVAGSEADIAAKS
ncbi:hypothetical protein LPJ57_002428, partial [Coemansia sp. RSA 486]